MKKCFSLLFASCLIFLSSTYCYSSVLPKSSPFQLGNAWYAKTNTWYTIHPDKPNLDFYYQSSPPGFSVVGSEYYQNEQTFADLFFQDVNGSDSNYFAGSYLFEQGYFVSLRYSKNTWTEMTLSPGYRFKVGSQGYAAVSLDYISDEYTNTSDITGFDVGFALYPEKTKIYGGINLPKAGNLSINLNANYQMSGTLIVGAGLQSDGVNNPDYNTGFTYKLNSIITDFQLGTHFSQNYYQFNVMYYLKKYGMGVFYQKFESFDDPEITLQGLYNLPKAKLVLKHTLQSSYDQLTSLAYEMKL